MNDFHAGDSCPVPTPGFSRCHGFMSTTTKRRIHATPTKYFRPTWWEVDR